MGLRRGGPRNRPGVWEMVNSLVLKDAERSRLLSSGVYL